MREPARFSLIVWVAFPPPGDVPLASMRFGFSARVDLEVTLELAADEPEDWRVAGADSIEVAGGVVHRDQAGLPFDEPTRIDREIPYGLNRGVDVDLFS